jgi:hypothetical protein
MLELKLLLWFSLGIGLRFHLELVLGLVLKLG